MAPAEVPALRVDQGGNRRVRRCNRAMPAGHGLGPHFAGPTVAPRVVPTRRGQAAGVGHFVPGRSIARATPRASGLSSSPGAGRNKKGRGSRCCTRPRPDESNLSSIATVESLREERDQTVLSTSRWLIQAHANY